MRNGNWVPISKAFLKHLPKDRPFTKLEADFSLQVDYDRGALVTIAGYADLWKWSMKKVRFFLERIGVEIIYPESTQKKQNQKGQIRVQMRNRSEGKKGQIRFIDSKYLQAKRNRSGGKKEQIRNRSGTSTKDPKSQIPKNKRTGFACHFEKSVGDFFEKIKANCEIVSKLKTRKGKTLNLFMWVQDQCNKKKHPGAIWEVTEALADKKTFYGIEKWPYAYANSILKTKNQNWNEKEAIIIHEKFKNMQVPDELRKLTYGLLQEIK